jgi:hypothetical protein
MFTKIKCDGIYDLRTLKHVLSLGVTSLSFDFSPASPNFVPEHILFNSLLPELKNNEEIFFYFESYNPLMVSRLFDKLKQMKFDNLNYIFDFKNLSNENKLDLNFKFITQYDQNYNFENYHNAYFAGLNLDYIFLQNLNDENKLRNFVSNFYYKNSFLLKDKHKLICNFNSLEQERNDYLDLFEFSTFSFKINPKLEVCYRNVDLKLLTKKITSMQSLINDNTSNKSANGKISKTFQTILN